MTDSFGASPGSSALDHYARRDPCEATPNLTRKHQGELRRHQPRLAEAPDDTVKQSRLRPIPLAGFEVTTYGRFWGDHRGLQQPVTARKPVGYHRTFLDSYRPNETPYLSRAERARLAEIGRSSFASDVAGTYAKQLLSRLLIDLSWNSSRLEGNTYSLLDTKRLIEFGQEGVPSENGQ